MSFLLPIVSAIGGAFAGSKPANTSTSNSTTYNNSSQTNGGQSTIARTLLGPQGGLLNTLGDFSTNLLTNPEKVVAPIRQAGINTINRRYAKAPQNIADKMLAFGGSKSGKFGRAVRESELSRTGDLNDFEGSLASKILDTQMGGAGLAERLLGMNFGSTSSTSGYDTGSNQQQFSGTNVGPSSPVAGGIGGGLSTIGTMLMLQKLLNGSGGGSAPYGQNYGDVGYQP